jgi:hypothetical protein
MTTSVELVSNVIRRRLSAYAEESELWNRDHRLAMASADFEDHLAFGLKLFDRITEIDQSWRREVFSGMVDYDSGFDAEIRELYEAWNKPCDLNEAVLSWLESRFGPVNHAEEFRSHCREVKGILTPDDQFFADEKLVDLRDQAIDDLRGGNVEYDGPG